MGEIISIFHGCMVWIEKSVTRVTSYTTNALNTRDFYPAPGEITWVR